MDSLFIVQSMVMNHPKFYVSAFFALQPPFFLYKKREFLNYEVRDKFRQVYKTLSRKKKHCTSMCTKKWFLLKMYFLIHLFAQNAFLTRHKRWNGLIARQRPVLHKGSILNPAGFRQGKNSCDQFLDDFCMNQHVGTDN